MYWRQLTVVSAVHDKEDTASIISQMQEQIADYKCTYVLQ